MNKLSTSQIRYLKSQNLKEYFERFPFYVWERLKFHAENPKISQLRETTLNEIFWDGLLNLMNLPLNFRLFHSTKEKVNGNDFEIFLEVKPGKFIYFPCQAKKIYINGEYEAISHPVGKYDKREQILNLIDYAEKVKGLPIYLFFNFTKQNFDTADLQKELYGCSFVDAFFIKNKYFDDGMNKLKTVFFQNIHPPAIPLISILDLIDSDFPKSLEMIFSEIATLPKLKFYSEPELLISSNFFEVNPNKDKKKSMFIPTNELKSLWAEEHKTFSSDFLPRYRILITINSIEKRIIDILPKINIVQNEQFN